MLTYLTRIAAAAAAFFSIISVSQATLIGDTVDISAHFPNLGTIVSSGSVVVGAGIEVGCPGPSPLCASGGNGLLDGESIDIGDFTIDLTFVSGFNPGAFSGWVFESLDVGGAIVGFILDTNIAGLDASRIAFGDDFLHVNMAGLGGLTGGVVGITLLTATQVPEPASLALLGGGLAALGLLHRRRRS